MAAADRGQSGALAAMADAIKHSPDDDDWVVWITPGDAAERAMRGLTEAGFAVVPADNAASPRKELS